MMLITMKIIKFIFPFVLGWVVGLLLYDYPLFFYSWEISAFDFLSLVVTSSIALYIARSIEGKLENRKTARDIVYARLDAIEYSLEKLLEEIGHEKEINYFKVVGITGSCRKRWQKVCEIMDNQYKPLIAKSNLGDYKNKVKSNFIKLNKLTTGEIVNQFPTIEVRENRIKNLEARFILISNEIDIIRNVFIDIKLLIND